MDARIVRTRNALQEALFGLAHDQSLDEISVGDIVERAGVNRSTFYQHYSDKETLLADAIDAAAEQAGADLIEFSEWPEEPPAALVAFLAHIDQHAALYRRVFIAPGSGVVLGRLREHVNQAVHEVAEQSPPMPHDVPLDVIAAGVAGSIIGVIAEWLSREPRASVDDAARWVWAVILGPPPVRLPSP